MSDRQRRMHKLHEDMLFRALSLKCSSNTHSRLVAPSPQQPILGGGVTSAGTREGTGGPLCRRNLWHPALAKQTKNQQTTLADSPQLYRLSCMCVPRVPVGSACVSVTPLCRWKNFETAKAFPHANGLIADTQLRPGGTSRCTPDLPGTMH